MKYDFEKQAERLRLQCFERRLETNRVAVDNQTVAARMVDSMYRRLKGLPQKYRSTIHQIILSSLDQEHENNNTR